MTPQEIQAELTVLRNTLGEQSRISLSITEKNDWHEECLTIHVWPTGIGNGGCLAFFANSFEDGLALARAGIAKRAEQARRDRIRKLALVVFDLKHAKGEATDIDLRQRGFSDAELQDLHTEAEALADEMATGAPFTVVFTAGSNGAPAEQVE